LALDGNNDEEYWYLQGVMAVWKNHMITAKIPHPVADFALRQVLLPKLRYPLIAMMLTEKQCQTILQPVLYHGLPAMGINRNMPRAVVHGPCVYQGLNIPNLFSEQMITHIQTLVKFGQHTTDATGFLVRACGELLWLELGIGGPIFQISHHLGPCVTSTWLSQCWLYCVQRGIEIWMDIYDFQPHRRNDREIMHILLSAGFRLDKLATLNCCHLFLHVIFLSDICNGTGTAVDNQFWVGEKHSSLYQYNWPQTPKPTQ